MSISPRLAAIAKLVEPGSRVADVGTDHGYLPIWLLQQGVSPFVIATDLRPGPLDTARRSGVAAGLSADIDFRLADGLAAVSPDEVDTLVIAGMGGETIQGILAAAPWLKQGGHRLILQPQSKIPELLDWLWQSGYRVTGQYLVEDANTLYTIFTVAPGSMPRPEGVGRYLCANCLEADGALIGAYIDQLCGKLAWAIDHMGQAKSQQAGQKRAQFTRELAELREMKGVLCHET